MLTTVTEIKPNKKQQECIDNIEGRYLVLAGPGTGKTYTVTSRILNMIEKGVNPETILCLTFTDAAANEMQKKLSEKAPNNTSGVNIYTYHGFCNEIINLYPEEFELSDNIKIITDSISRAFIKECIDELNPKAFRTKKNDPYSYINTIKDLINEIKKYRLTREKYFHNLDTNPDWRIELNRLNAKLEEKNQKGDTSTIKLQDDINKLEKKIEKINELWKFYELYNEKMAKKHYIDFNDMISLVLNKFENSPSFLNKIANNYKYILVDEYQDTNSAQNSIIFNLTKALESKNVFVVGDDDQTIYSFQGAKLDTIERFLEEFPDTEVICLEENMRSTQNILDIAREITKQDTKRIEINPKFQKYNISKELKSKNPELDSKQSIKVKCTEYADIEQEYNHIVNSIEELINSDECPKDKNNNKKYSEIAILARTNKELDEFAQMLKIKGIPYELKEGKSIFTIKSSIVLLCYMQLLVNPQLYSDRIFRYLLSKPFNINPVDYEVLYENRSRYQCFIDIMRNIDKSKLKEPEKIEQFIKTFDYLKEYNSNENLKNTILEIGNKTGIFQYYMNSEINKSDNIAGLKKIVEEADSFLIVNETFSLEDFVYYLDRCIIDEIDIRTDKAPVEYNAVQLCTYYSSKGREFSCVYMPSLISEKWESDNKTLKAKIPLPSSEYKNEDERKEMKRSDRIKVLYVGMTRAKYDLNLSYFKKSNGKDKEVSKFIKSIIPLIEKQTFSYDENSYWEEAKNSLMKRDYDYKTEFNSFIDSRLQTLKFSPSSVNKYLACPRKYFYETVLGLESKSGNEDDLHYGTSVHEALEFAINYAIKNGEYPSQKEFIDVFNNKLDSLPLSSFEQKKIRLVRGAKFLDKYHHHQLSNPPGKQLSNPHVKQLYKTEFKLEFERNNSPITIKIDRIDKNSDNTYSIYDYKTGNAKDKNENTICIGGEHEDYYNQIGIYKYFFEEQMNCKVKDVAFIFPEDYTNNLTFSLSDEETKAIIDKFDNAIKNIKEHNFEPNKCETSCQYCSYKEFCQLDTI